MKLSKVMALGAAGVLLFGTSLFSRDRDNPSWAWTSNGAAAANLRGSRDRVGVNGDEQVGLRGAGDAHPLG